MREHSDARGAEVRGLPGLREPALGGGFVLQRAETENGERPVERRGLFRLLFHVAK